MPSREVCEVTQPYPAALTPARWTSYRDIYFGYDNADLRPAEMVKISELAAYSRQNPSVRLGVDGYTDSQASTRYNPTLSQRRTAAVRDALIQSGVPADRIDIGQFGNTRPACNETVPECWQRDARVQVLIRPAS